LEEYFQYFTATAKWKNAMNCLRNVALGREFNYKGWYIPERGSLEDFKIQKGLNISKAKTGKKHRKHN
jgi:hypothetical protein